MAAFNQTGQSVSAQFNIGLQDNIESVYGTKLVPKIRMCYKWSEFHSRFQQRFPELFSSKLYVQLVGTQMIRPGDYCECWIEFLEPEMKAAVLSLVEDVDVIYFEFN